MVIRKKVPQAWDNVWTTKEVAVLEKIVSTLEMGDRGADAVSVALKAIKRPMSRVAFTRYMRGLITTMEKEKKLTTARNYKHTLSSFQRFLGNYDLRLSSFRAEVVDGYAEWLASRGVVRNTVSFYMRILRAVYNRAVEEGLIGQAYPFRHVYTGVDRTRKRAVDENVVVRLQNLDLSATPPLALSRDLFVFSYCTRGMAFVDIAFLKKKDVSGGHISYVRHKTGQRLTIRVEPCMARIMARYAAATAGRAYVFPLLADTEPQAAFRQYQTALGYHNRKLKDLGRMLGLPLPLSSYIARHTWATTARNHNVPISVISAGMGHASEGVTQVYLAAVENSVIDRVNKGMLSALNDMDGKKK